MTDILVKIVELLEKGDLLQSDLAKKAGVESVFLDKLLPVFVKYGIASTRLWGSDKERTWYIESVNAYWSHEESIQDDIKEFKPKKIREVVVSSEPMTLAWDFADTKVINPSLDFFDGKMYLTQTLPFNTEKGVENKTVMITSDRRVLVLEKDAMKNGVDGIRITGWPNSIKNRWSSLGIREYLTNINQNVSFKELYNDIYFELEREVEFKDKRYCGLLTCWIIGTYFFPIFEAYPYIYLLGVKRTGKTKVLTLASLLSFNARLTAGMTTATLFRMVEGNRSILCIDELEGAKFSKDPDFRALMLASYKKGLMVPRSRKLESGRIVLDEFEPYGPKMMVSIRGFDDVMEDRALMIVMERGTNPDKINKRVNIDDPIYQEVRDDLYDLCLNRPNQVAKQIEIVDKVWLNKEVGFSGFVDSLLNIGVKLDPSEVEKILSNKELKVEKLPTTIDNNPINPTNAEYYYYIYTTLQTLLNTTTIPIARDRELALPVLTMASLCDFSVFKDTYELLCDIFVTKQEDDVSDSAENTLLQALLEMVQDKKFYRVAEITSLLKEKEGIGEWANTKWVGRAIKRLGISTKKRVVNGRAEVLLDVDAIKKKAKDMGINTEEIVKDVVADESGDEAIKRIIKNKCMLGVPGAPYDVVIEEAEKAGVKNIEKLIGQMLLQGIIFEPRQGLLRLTGG